ncbi:uncharacterized protein LOC110980414 isoform X2 [Acanthaster planci]|uniref:Uncharacterized protein LOC110980414 isoform X2 n=1 Tax=Acanthaster planci TaxID=133434 RepID=A0A8B7YMQ5_ACAPL|nr:uncharacterized protein LOC110980414 isoform X2 [Acanthaster planci]
MVDEWVSQKWCQITCRWTSTRPTSRRLPIVHHDDYVCTLPPKHRFPMSKFTKVYNHLLQDGVIQPDQVAVPTLVTMETAASVHTTDYVDKFFSGKTSEKEQRRTGFAWTEGLVRRCRMETGGTVLAAHMALSRGLACSTAGGTHHAYPNFGSGFCLLNDLAVAARQVQLIGKASRILILDLDVHQGDGTAFIFQNDSSVFTFSVHCGKNFPFRKEKSDLDISVQPKLRDKEYLLIVKEQLPWILESFRPDLVLYDAGVDPHKNDDLGMLSLTDQGLHDRDYWVIDHITSRGIPCACVIGGGYSKDIGVLAMRHTIVHRAATKVWEERRL